MTSNFTPNTLPVSLVEIFQEDYKLLQSAHHKMLNAMRKTPRKEYSNDAVMMLLKIQELNQSLLYLCSQTELELLESKNLESKNPEAKTKKQEQRTLTLRREQKILKKWMPYVLRDMLDEENNVREQERIIVEQAME